MPIKPIFVSKEGLRTDVYNALRHLADGQRGASRAFGSIERGESPDSSGDPLTDKTLFFYKPGLAGGQIAFGDTSMSGTLTFGSTAASGKGKIFLGTASPRVAYDETNCFLGVGTDSPATKIHAVTTALGTAVVGALGTTWARFGYAATTKLDFAPLLQVAGTVDAAIMATTGGIQFFDTDFNGAAFRMAFSSNRSFLQAGRINSSSVAINRNLTIGGINATVGATSQVNFQGITFATTAGSTEGAVAISANDALVTVNLSADDYLSSLAASRPSMLVGPRANVPTCAALVVEQGSLTVSAFEYRGASTGSAPAKVLGLVRWAFGPGLGASNTEGALIGYRSGAETVRLQPLVASSANWAFISTAQLNQLEHLVSTGLWGDSLAATTTRFALGDTASSTRVVCLTSGGGNIFDRFGICTQGFTVENTTLGGGAVAISAPLALLYLVNNATNGTDAKNLLTLQSKRAGQSGDYFQIRNSVGTVIYTITSGILVGINTSAPTNDLSFGGEVARKLWMEKRTAANVAGNNFSIQAGGASVGGTNRAGGTLILMAGDSTGSAASAINLQTATPGTAGTGTNSPSTKISIAGTGAVVHTVSAFAATGGMTQNFTVSSGISATQFNGNTWNHILNNIVDSTIYGLQLQMTPTIDSTDSGGSSIQGFGFEIFENGESGTGASATAIGGFIRHSSTAAGLTYIGCNLSINLATGAGDCDVILYAGTSTSVAATATTFRIFYGINPTLSGAGAITTLYGLHLTDMTAGTTNWAIYSEGGQSAHVGKLALGSTTSPAEMLDIYGNIKLADTTNGTKIGTATTQKLAFWNATPIVQPTTAVAAATFVANTSAIANDSATFDGYTIGQVVKALRNMGLLA